MPTVLDKLFWADKQKLPVETLQSELAQKYPGHLWVATTGTSSLDSNLVKWVAHKKSNLLQMAKRQSQVLGLTKACRFLNVLPPTHVANLMASLRVESAEAEMFSYYDYCDKWSAKSFVKLFEENDIQYSSLVPAQVFDIVSEELKAPRIPHRILVGGGAISDELIINAKALGWCVLRSYGSSETAAFIAMNTYEDWSNANYEMKLLDPVQLRLSESDLLCIACPFLFEHYLFVDQQKQTYKLQEPKRIDQYWISEDLASIDGEYLSVRGRGSRFAKILGESISLDQEEEFWQRKLGVGLFLGKQADERRGEHLVLCCENIASFKEQITKINQDLPGPKRILSLSDLPVIFASNGKKLYARMQESLKSSEKISL